MRREINNINICSLLLLHFNWLILSFRDDFSIKLLKQLKNNTPTLFLKLSDIMTYLLYKSFNEVNPMVC